MKNSDMPAMPLNSDEHADGFMNRQSIAITTAGLTKREHFAGLAMQGMLTNPCDYSKPEHAAHDAIMYADALLAALEQDQAK